MKALSRFITAVIAIVCMAIHRWLVDIFGPQSVAPVRLCANEWTRIVDLWVPTIFAEAMQEPIVENTSFLDSGVVATSPELATLASGSGTSVTIPFLLTPNHDDQLQTQDTAPEMRRMTSGSQIAAMFNRVSPLGATALSSVVTGVRKGGDILTHLAGNILGLRKRQRNRLVIAELAGLFGVASAPNASTGAFKDLRKDAFSETGASPAAGLLIDSTKMLQTLTLLGENEEMMVGGSIIMHPDIMTALVDQDQIDVIRNSEGAIILRAWKGMKVYVSKALKRAGGTSGFVYYTYFFAPGAIAMGDMPQVVTDDAGYVAAVQLDKRDIAKNNVAIYDRTRFMLHPQGAKWTGTPSNTDAGPSNAEVATAGNWALGANDLQNVRIACLRTNG